MKWKCEICGKEYTAETIAFLIVAGTIETAEDNYRGFRKEKTFGPICIYCAKKVADRLTGRVKCGT